MLSYYIVGFLLLIVGGCGWWYGIAADNLLGVIIFGLAGSFGAAILVTIATEQRRSPGTVEPEKKSEESGSQETKKILSEPQAVLRRLNEKNAANVGRHFAALAMRMNEAKDSIEELSVLEVDNDEVLNAWSGSDIDEFLDFVSGIPLIVYEDRRPLRLLAKAIEETESDASLQYMDIMPLVRKLYPGYATYRFTPLMKDLDVESEQSGIQGKSEMLAELFINVLDDDVQSESIQNEITENEK